MAFNAGLGLPRLGRPLFYPDATLALDFTTAQYRVGAGGFSSPDFASLPGLTVSRASVGYAERQDGTLVQFGNNVARITDKGLLVEESRTNSLLFSNNPNGGSGWITPGTTGVSAAQNAASPDGLGAGWTITQTGANGSDSRLQQNVNVANDTTTYTASWYVPKAANAPTVFPGFQLNFSSGATPINTAVVINPQTGASVNTAGAATYRVEDKVTFWRVSITLANNATGNTVLSVQHYPAYANSLTTTKNTVNGGVGPVVFMQAEVGSFPTSYIPTTSASATRAADGVSVGGLNYAQGTIIARALGAATSSNVRLVGTNGNTTTVLFEAATGIGTYNGTTAQTKATTITPGVAFKAGSTWTVGTRSVTVNGLAPVDDGASGHPTVLSIELGRDATSGGQNFWNSYIQSAVIYPTAFSDAQLQAATQ